MTMRPDLRKVAFPGVGVLDMHVEINKLQQELVGLSDYGTAEDLKEKKKKKVRDLKSHHQFTM